MPLYFHAWCIMIWGVGSNFGLAQQIKLLAKANLAAHAGRVWGHASQGKF